LDENSQRRKREITTINFLIKQAKRPHEKQAVLRLSVPILYAHWEGFIKYASLAYLYYINGLSNKLKDLQINFLAMSCKNKIMYTNRSNKNIVYQNVIEYIFNDIEQNLSIVPENHIDTESNLTSEVLRNIFFTIGLDYTDYWTKKENIVDYSLLKLRNEIAHGELVQVDENEFNQISDFVIETINCFKSEIENAVTFELFKKT